MPIDPEPKPLSRLEAMRKAAAAASDRPLNPEPPLPEPPDPRIKSKRAARVLALASEIAAEWRALGLTREQISAMFAIVVSGNAAATGTTTAPPKPGERSAEARDARAKARGRLPAGTVIHGAWVGATWIMTMSIRAGVLHPCLKSFTHSAPDGGLFRTLEELDIRFWEWFASDADKEIKAVLHFAPEPEAK